MVGKPEETMYSAAKGGLIALARGATPQEVADTVLFMVSPESSYVTGAVLPVDGGYTAY